MASQNTQNKIQTPHQGAPLSGDNRHSCPGNCASAPLTTLSSSQGHKEALLPQGLCTCCSLFLELFPQVFPCWPLFFQNSAKVPPQGTLREQSIYSNPFQAVSCHETHKKWYLPGIAQGGADGPGWPTCHSEGEGCQYLHSTETHFQCQGPPAGMVWPSFFNFLYQNLLL